MSRHTHSKTVFLALLFLMLSIDLSAQKEGISKIYPTTYKDWANGFLSGNGKMGIIVFGNPLNETVVYNDRYFNLAKTKDRSFAQVSKEDLQKIKELCAEGKFGEADTLATVSAHYSGGGDGNIHPGYEMKIHIDSSGKISNYERVCNFRTGEIIVKWHDNRGDWQRKSFVSRKDNVVVQSITAPTNAKLNCTLLLNTNADMGFPKGMDFMNVSDADYLNFRAKYPEGTGDVGYEGATRVIVHGGKKYMEGNVLHIVNAQSVLLLTRTKKYYTDCEAQWNKKLLQKELQNIPANYNTLLQGQIETHEKIFDRVQFSLNANPADELKTNEALLAEQRNSPDAVKALWERIFYAGRYYFLSSSDSINPPDLLGIWAGDCSAGWGGYYHLDANLNLQVAGGNIGNMPECMEGYFSLNEAWRKDFEINATKLLGCRGMVAAGNTPGRTSGLMANINYYYPYQYATGEEGWLLYPFWEHYMITGDKKFLREQLYPLLKDMGYFYEDFLKLKDSTGHYIFAGSVSPENQPSNLHVSLLNNSLFDISGAKFCLSTLLKTCNILGLQQSEMSEIKKWTKILQLLPPYLINNYENAGHGILHSALIAANLKNSEAVYHKLLRLTKEDFYFNSLATAHYPNHRTFCTDVCNTVPAIFMEMLVGSDSGTLELLPALPEYLSSGSIAGIKGRNRVTVQQLNWNMQTHEVNCVLVSDVNQTISLIFRKGIKNIVSNAHVSPSPLKNNMARKIRLKKAKQVHIKISF
ncbi:hypothetical protein A9P82_12195 [Arachidicoccus ginsenosidimutans]|uniref:glycosyl hydrolase family 95 catalytic domain-containing protein n=1 Tax=Arachidicoccus sp. BS20 TaxID=1850526 RepID=UPI0007F0CC29|nr:glycoside hydrolase N-terminal domain-containing protein [Arachidicoccus sp. BS20]ANI89979.1 hypothetical protein A9P82_12195 [Arachidicoccus sp. BS20]